MAIDIENMTKSELKKLIKKHKKKDKDKKKEAAKMLGTGGARKAADAMINRHKILDDMVNGSSKKKRK